MVCITGAAGQIGYILSQLVASGQVFGEAPIHLRLLDIKACLRQLEGVQMELEDCAFPLLQSIMIGCSANDLFLGIDVGIFVGGFPRKAGMERKELIAINSAIYKAQGDALNKYAKKTCKILVVANPANTNCSILSHYAPTIPKSNFTCLTRLDHNRALSLLAKKAHCNVESVRNVVIWGNHSSTQYPDASSAQIKETNANIILDSAYLRSSFISEIQQRGAAILNARKASSAISAANAIKDHMRDWYFGTRPGEFVSMGVISNNEYGVSNEICFSFPCVCRDFEYQIVEGRAIDAFSKKMLIQTENELIEEKKEAMSVWKPLL